MRILMFVKPHPSSSPPPFLPDVTDAVGKKNKRILNFCACVCVFKIIRSSLKG